MFRVWRLCVVGMGRWDVGRGINKKVQRKAEWC